MTKEKGQNKVQTITLFCTFSLAIGLSVLYFVLFLLLLDCLYFILYFLAKEKVQNKVQTIQWPKKKYKIRDRQSND
jgi:Ca2+/Na+ antiporter